VLEKLFPSTKSFHLQYFSKLCHGKNVAQKNRTQRAIQTTAQNSRIIVSGGFDNGQKEIQKWYVETEEEFFFMAV
jgi:hypothetical protein